MRTCLIALLLAAVPTLHSAEPPKPFALTDAQKLEVRTLQLRLARIAVAKAQIATEEKTATDALNKLVQEFTAKGCELRDDLTCEKHPEAAKAEAKK